MKESAGPKIALGQEERPEIEKRPSIVPVSTMVLIVACLVSSLSGAAAYAFFSTLRMGPPRAQALSLLPPPSGEDPGSVPSGGAGATVSGKDGGGGMQPTSPPVLPEPSDFHDEAVRDTIHKHFPLQPSDIDLIRKTLKETQKAVHGSPPVGRAISVSVSLDPGAPFPDIRLVPGIASTITVVDATGAPWPIEDVIVGNAKSFPVRRLSTPNGVVVEPKNNVGWTSLALSLAGRGTPAVLRLVSSDRVSDTRVTARIEARGPNAKTPVFSEPQPLVSSRILAYLDGIPPGQARALPVRGTKDMEAWLDGNRLFVRTHMDVLAPAWTETVSGPNGMKLYVFPPVSVITAAGEDGEMKTVELGEKDGQ